MSRPRFIPQTDVEVAACCFVSGALAALTPVREFYEIEPVSGLGVGSYERARHCEREIARIDREDKLATLDRCLALIAARRDITQFLEAAE
ncbi:hypothetical protein ASE63_22270 [Bosea sp. Root381]|uniref:hypothetical protein n=1 Tax=Bosea sp. Root381 TaxID=1736524 RepID=UPI000700BDEB|nr:hypothetical protein [Bosea sp. Root381]KRE07428.1 hypothetical protein ASE63_22270 [Bosea sp. Root381]